MGKVGKVGHNPVAFDPLDPYPQLPVWLHHKVNLMGVDLRQNIYLTHQSCDLIYQTPVALTLLR